MQSLLRTLICAENVQYKDGRCLEQGKNINREYGIGLMLSIKNGKQDTTHILLPENFAF
jgi:hypothetical protein